MYRLLQHQDESLRFKLDSSEYEGNRFTVVLGPNGTGKSQLLRSIAEINRASSAKSKEHVVDPAGPHSAYAMSALLVLSNMVSDVFVNTSKRRDSYRYLGLRQASNNTSTGSLRDVTGASILECFKLPDGMRRLWPVMTTLGGNRFGVTFNRNSSRTKISSNETALVSKFLNNLELDYDRSHYMSAEALFTELRDFNSSIPNGGELFDLDAPEMALFWSILARFQLEALDLIRLLRQLRYIEVRVHILLGTGFVDLDTLSTGQLLLLSTFARVAAHIKPGSLVIIDEPEAGLHPNWQSEWIPLMRATIPPEYGCHLFIATHSPYLVSDADDVLVPGKEWGTFVQFDEPYQGRSVENILYRVFGARVSGNLMVEDDLRTLVQLISRSAIEPTPDQLEEETEDAPHQLRKARSALHRLRRMQGQDTENINRIIAQASEVLAR